MKWILDSKTISGIPVLEIYPDNISGKRPLIFLMHGVTGKKENMVEYGLEFAKEGFFGCLFDAHIHGELKPDTVKEPDDYYHLEPKLFFIDETAKMINILLDAYAESPFIDSNRVGLMGVSMGGLVIYKYLTDYYRGNIKVVVPMIASPAWYNAIKNYMATMNKPDFYSREDLEYIKSIDPFKVIKNIRDVPLLMLNGDNDSTVPIEDIRICYSILKENYSNKDRLKFIEYPGIGHQVTESMVNETKIWFIKFLR